MVQPVFSENQPYRKLHEIGFTKRYCLNRKRSSLSSGGDVEVLCYAVQCEGSETCGLMIVCIHHFIESHRLFLEVLS